MKDKFLQLAYDYKNIEARELLYKKLSIETKIRFGLREDNTNLTVNSQSQLLKNEGFCKLGTLDKKICDYLVKKYYPIKNSDDTKIKAKININMEELCSDSIVLQIFTKEKIVRTIENYLGILPTIQSITSWRSIGLDNLNRENEMYWHMDHHGHRFVKVFFYLTDVDYGHGHHQYIIKTHLQNEFDAEMTRRPELKNLKNEIVRKRHQRGNYKVEDDAVWPIAERIKDVTGKAGSGFMEDTRGLHRGTVIPPNKERIIIQALMLPFDSGKDKNVQKRIKKSLFDHIKKENNYSEEEMFKLLHNLKVIKNG